MRFHEKYPYFYKTRQIHKKLAMTKILRINTSPMHNTMQGYMSEIKKNEIGHIKYIKLLKI